MRPSFARRRALFAVLVSIACTPALAQSVTEWRSAYLDCGGTRVRALAECYENTRFCLSDTLTFERGGRRTVVALHQHYGEHDLAKLKLKAKALNYRAGAWACLEGAAGGHYVTVVMHVAGTSCTAACAYEQTFDTNGRLAVSRVTFDGDGTPREIPGSFERMLKLVRTPPRDAYTPVYR